MPSPRPDPGEPLGDVTDDAVLGGRLRLLQPRRGHRAGHDAILLAAAAPRARHAVDLGAGVGTAGLALLIRGGAERVTLVDADAELCALARANAVRNGVAARVAVVDSDINVLARRGGPVIPKAGGADLVIANPPFNDPAARQASPRAARRRAHVAAAADLDAWVRAAERLLRPAGTLVLIHRPEALATALDALKRRFGAVELIPILPRADRAAIRLIVRARKGRRTPLVLRPSLVLEDASGAPAAQARAVLSGAAPLDPV
jgi:tRNA1(Val) A37 N6-methylase TrmN6